MPWWTWILIWVALLALTLLVLAGLGFFLFRKVKGVLAEIQTASEALDRSTTPPVAPAAADSEPEVAVFRDPADVNAERIEGKMLRVAARRERRIHRRVTRSQPVSLKDLPHV